MEFPNNYYHRKVADIKARPCEICFKPSTSVLTTLENKDFFFVCPSHLQDRGFCTPIIDQEAVEARKRKELEDEVARVKKEYEEKQRQKRERQEREKEKEKPKKNEKDSSKEEEIADAKVKNDGYESKNKRTEESSAVEEEPRAFELKRLFYHQRLEKRRQAEVARRNRERLQNPSFFPSVPQGQP